MQDIYQFLISTILPTVILFLGLIGNTFGLIIVCTSKSSEKIGPRRILRYLFVFDFIYFPLIIISYLQYGYSIDPLIINRAICKTYWFLNYSLAIQSPLFVVYLSVERFISLAFPAKKIYLNKDNIQNIYIIIVIFYNLILYTPIAIYFDTYDLNNETNQNTSNVIITCNFITFDSQVFLSYIDLFNRVLLPSLLMVIFSIGIIYTIFKSRSRLSTSKLFVKDVKFSIASIFLNVIYLLLSLPVSIVVFFPDYATSNVYIIANYFYFASYGVNFYVMLTFNHLFKTAFVDLFKIDFKGSTLKNSS